MNGSACCVPDPRLFRSVLALLATLLLVTPAAAEAVLLEGDTVDAVVLVPETSTADFAAGTHDGTAVSESDCGDTGGQLRLQPPLSDLFLTSSLDPQWIITEPGGSFTPVITDGVLDVQERDDDSYELSAIESQATYTAGVVCEMRAAIFAGSAFVHLGFLSSTESLDQWLYFSTRGTGDSAVPTIMTSMHTATSSTLNVPTTVSLGEFHVFRIVWTPGAAEFWVDGVLVDSRTDVDIDLPQHVAMYKSSGSDSPCLVDWVRVTPYSATTGTFTSAVQDAGEPGRSWTRLSWQGEVPAAATAAFATRTGETPAPDAGWSDWSDVTGDLVTSPPGRYLQYRAGLATADSLTSPVIDAIQLEFSYADLIAPTVVATAPAPGASAIPCGAVVAAQFDEAIDPATLTVASFTLAPAGGDPLLATLTLDAAGTTATLTPTAPLACATTFEVRLTTDLTDGDGNHLAADHLWTFTTEAPDLAPPVILAATPAPGQAAVLPGRSLTVLFDEAVDPATINTASFTLAPLDGTVIVATVTYDPETRRATLDPVADLELATDYQVRLTTAVTDLAGNPLAADEVWTFTTRVDPVSVLSATSAADFAAGSLAGLAVAETDSSAAAGQLRIAPSLGDRFDQPDLDPQWHATRPEGYVPVIENGLLDVQERDDDDYELSAIESYAEFGPGVVLEARAMFVLGSQFIDVGLDGSTYNNSQYAWFSTAGTGNQGADARIYARVREYGHDTTAIETSAQYGQWHVYKIVWTHARVEFYVDGVLEATFTDVLITLPMHAAFYKSRESETPFFIDWIRVTPYAEATGEYVSPVLDGGLEPTAWLDLQWSGAAPTGTAVVFATRTGETPAPDETWSDWSDTAGDDVTSPAARYAQYRATLSTDDPLLSPVIDAVHLTHGPPADLTSPVVLATTPAADAVDVPLATTVSATFSEPVDPATLTGESFLLIPDGGTAVSATLSWDAETFTVTLTPASDLAENTLFEASVTTAVRDEAGNAMSVNHVWSFTTEAGVVGVPDLPVVTALQPNYPNPFNPSTTVRFDLARQQRVSVRIYGIDGRLVRTLVAGELAAGRHTRIWDGRTDTGQAAPTGIYLLRLVSDDLSTTRKLSMIK